MKAVGIPGIAMQPTREVFEFGRLQGDFPVWAAVAAVAVAIVCWRLYSTESKGRPWALRWAFPLLRLAAFALLAFVFLDPRVRTETTVRRQPRISLLVDRSQSMSHVDAGASPDKRSRVEKVAQSLADVQGAWADRDVESFTFGAALSPHTGDWRGVRPDAQETRLGDAVVETLRKNAERPPAAIVVVTDGRSNAGVSVDAAIRAARQVKVPVHTVAVGSELAPPNLRLADLRIPSRVYRGDQVKGSVLVQSTGLPDGPVEVTFTLKAKGGGGGRKVGGAVVAVKGDGGNGQALLAFEPPPPGQWELVASTPVKPSEVDAADNVATAAFEVVDRRTRVLLFSSGPSREYQFLRNLIFRDSTFELSVLLQTASRGASQEAKQVLTKFPASREEIFAYDCLVALDPDWSRVDPAGRAAVAEWASRQAGGMVFVGGSGTNVPEIANLSPVVAGELEAGRALSRDAWPLQLTSEGESTPALRLADDASTSKRIWEEFPGFYELQNVARVKPGASVWLRSSDPLRRTAGTDEPAPALAVHFFGAGRAAWLGSPEMWRLRRVGEKYYERFWTQMIRQVCEGRLLRGSGRGALIAERKQISTGSQAPVRAWLLDERFQPLKSPGVRLSVVTTAGPRETELAAQPGQPGRYAGVLSGLPPGEVRLQLPLSGGEVLEETLRVADSGVENEDVRADRATLKRLAKESGGEAVELSELKRLVSSLPAEPEESILSGTPRPLWDRAWLAVLFVAILGSEWILRKLNHLS